MKTIIEDACKFRNDDLSTDVADTLGVISDLHAEETDYHQSNSSNSRNRKNVQKIKKKSPKWYQKMKAFIRCHKRRELDP